MEPTSSSRLVLSPVPHVELRSWLGLDRGSVGLCTGLFFSSLSLCYIYIWHAFFLTSRERVEKRESKFIYLERKLGAVFTYVVSGIFIICQHGCYFPPGRAAGAKSRGAFIVIK